MESQRDHIKNWVCIYPSYINSNKKMSEGRRVPLTHSCPDPTPMEIAQVCQSVGLNCAIEEDKSYSRDPSTSEISGRVKVQLKDNGQPLSEFPNKLRLLRHIGSMIPKLKSRVQKKNSTQSSSSSAPAASTASASSKSNKKKGKKKR